MGTWSLLIGRKRPCRLTYVVSQNVRAVPGAQWSRKGSVDERHNRDYIEARCNHGAATEAQGARPACGAGGQLHQVAGVLPRHDRRPQSGERFVESPDDLNFERHRRLKRTNEGRSRCGD